MCEVSTPLQLQFELQFHLNGTSTSHSRATANQLVVVEAFTGRMRNQSRWWLMPFAADLSTSWLMENANMKLSKN